MIWKDVATVLTAITIMLPSSGLAGDMYDFPNSNYQPTTRQFEIQQKALDHKRKNTICNSMQIRLHNETEHRTNQLFDNGFDTSDSGWVLNDSIQIYLRDLREEMTREIEDMHTVMYSKGYTVDECSAVLKEYERRYVCYFNNAMNNTSGLNRNCSDLYKRFIDPDRYYHGATKSPW